jgi:hypothetical protein
VSGGNVTKVNSKQGDQSGRIFTQWTIVLFGQFIENYRSSANSLATFFQSTSYVGINFDKKMVGLYTSGDVFKNSSGHPDSKELPGSEKPLLEYTKSRA